MTELELDTWVAGYRPANGTEGIDFMSRFCAGCRHDHAMHDDGDPGDACPIALNAIELRPVDEWERRWFVDPDSGDTLSEARCTKFERCMESAECVKLNETPAERNHRLFYEPVAPIEPAAPKPIEGQVSFL